MKKAITFVALAGLASASNFSLKMLQDKQIQELAIGAIEAEIVKAKEYVAAHPEVILGLQAQALRYQQDQNAWKTDVKFVMEKIAQHPEILAQILGALKNIEVSPSGEITIKGMIDPAMMRNVKVLNFDDQELFAADEMKVFSLKMLQDKEMQELVIQHIEAEIRKAKEYVATHPEVVIGIQAQVARYQQDKEAWKRDVKFVMEQVAAHPEIINQVLETLKNFNIYPDGDVTVKYTFQPRKFAPLAFDDEELFAFDDEELFAFEDNELFNIKMLQDKNMQDLVIQSIESDINKAKEYVAAHPEVIEGVKAQINRYTQDKNAWKSDVKLAMEKIAQHPEVVAQILGALQNINIDADGEIKMAANFQPRRFAPLGFEDHDFFAFDDNELFSLKVLEDKTMQELVIQSIESDFRKAKDYVAAHPEVIEGVKAQINRYKQDKEAWKNDVRFIMNQIAQHPEIVNEVLGALKSINIDASGEIKMTGNFQPRHFAPIGFEDEEFFAFDDNELFQAKQVHGFKDLGFEDQTDNNLFSLGDLIKDGKKIKDDVKNHNVKDMIKDGSKMIKDAKDIKKFLA